MSDETGETTSPGSQIEMKDQIIRELKRCCLNLIEDLGPAIRLRLWLISHSEKKDVGDAKLLHKLCRWNRDAAFEEAAKEPGAEKVSIEVEFEMIYVGLSKEEVEKRCYGDQDAICEMIRNGEKPVLPSCVKELRIMQYG